MLNNKKFNANIEQSDWYQWLEYKFKIRRKINIIKSWKPLLRFWLVPMQVEKLIEATKMYRSHIKELDGVIEEKDNKIQCTMDDWIDFRGSDRLKEPEDERTATRRVYQLVYGSEPDEYGYTWIDHIDGKFLTKKEDREWFDRHHDRTICSGDEIANADYQNNGDYLIYELKERGLYD